MHSRDIMNHLTTKIFSDKQKLEIKKQIFKKSYINHKDLDSKKDKIILVTDFDYTLFNKYNYSTGEKYDGSFGMYNQDVFGGDQKNFLQKRKNLYNTYIKYEEDFTIDEKTKKEKLIEWSVKQMEDMLHPNFTRDSIRKMVEMKNDKRQIYLKKNIGKFYEKLIELNIPIIIVSAGVKEIIIDFLELLNIKGLDDYIKNKKILFVANEFVFDGNGKCINFNRNIIHGYNKSEYVKKLVDEYFPNIENAFVLGDLCTDYKSIEKLNLNKDQNIIGIRFIYYTPDDLKNKDFNYENNKQINEYKKIYDVNLLMEEGYDFPLELLSIFDN